MYYKKEITDSSNDMDCESNTYNDVESNNEIYDDDQSDQSDEN